MLTVDPTRPFEPTGMTTARWLELPPSTVPTHNLVLSQDGVTISGLLHHRHGGPSWCGDPHIHLVAHHGRLHVADGHHRLTLALLDGATEVQARVLRRTK